MFYLKRVCGIFPLLLFNCCSESLCAVCSAPHSGVWFSLHTWRSLEEFTFSFWGGQLDSDGHSVAPGCVKGSPGVLCLSVDVFLFLVSLLVLVVAAVMQRLQLRAQILRKFSICWSVFFKRFVWWKQTEQPLLTGRNYILLLEIIFTIQISFQRVLNSDDCFLRSSF